MMNETCNSRGSPVSSSKPSDITNGTSSTKTMRREGLEKTAISGRKSVKPGIKAFAQVMLAKNSRRTPNQVKAATIERNDNVNKVQIAIK